MQLIHPISVLLVMVHVPVAMELRPTVSVVQECSTMPIQQNYAKLHVLQDSSTQPLPIPANFVTQNVPHVETATAATV